MPFSALGGLAQGYLGLVGNIYASQQQKTMNSRNLAEQQRMNNYQMQLNERQIAREDNAVQRRVADLRKAGLSPTLAAGSAAEASGQSAPPAAQMSTSHIDTLSRGINSAAAGLGAAGSGLSSGLNSAISNGATILSTLSSVKKQQAEIAQTNAQAQYIDTQRRGAELSNALALGLNPLKLRKQELENQISSYNHNKSVESGVRTTDYMPGYYNMGTSVGTKLISGINDVYTKGADALTPVLTRAMTLGGSFFNRALENLMAPTLTGPSQYDKNRAKGGRR